MVQMGRERDRASSNRASGGSEWQQARGLYRYGGLARPLSLPVRKGMADFCYRYASTGLYWEQPTSGLDPELLLPILPKRLLLSIFTIYHIMDFTTKAPPQIFEK